jgi:SAM-dependent methyltransferase
MNRQSYVLDNDEPTAEAMLDCLSGVLDDFTATRLEEAGIRDGARCLELGAGNGSIAAWLAQRVGTEGMVLATDVKPRHVRPHPGVLVLSHDVTSDELPAGQFELVHARLLLAHLPERREVLKRLADALTPDGVLVIEEWGAWPGRVLWAAQPDAAALYERYQTALLRVFASWGNDSSWAARVPAEMAAVGLVDVETMVHARSWRGGSPGCRLPVAVSRELREELVRAGLSEADLDRLPDVMRDPELVLLGNLTWSTIGRRR